MNTAIRNLGPVLALVGAVNWWCWPHVGGADSPLPDLGGGGLSRIEKCQLTPAISASCSRNPFEPIARAPQPTAGGPELTLAELERAEELTAPAIDLEPIVQSLTLGGTFVSGQRNCALIEGQLCFEGQQFSTRAEEGGPCVLTRVMRDRVVLRAGGEEHQLSFRDATTSARRKTSGADPDKARLAPAVGVGTTPKRRPSGPKASGGSPAFWQLLDDLKDLVPSPAPI